MRQMMDHLLALWFELVVPGWHYVFKQFLDNQLAPAVLQVVAAVIVAFEVRRRGIRDRKIALTVAFDREWNSTDIMAGRHAIRQRLLTGAPAPQEVDKDFQSIWLVIMFVRRVHSLKKAQQLDKDLFENLLQLDAGRFAPDIYSAWGAWGASKEEWATLSTKPL